MMETGRRHGGEDGFNARSQPGGETPSSATLPPDHMPSPFDTDTFRLSMGLRALDPVDWTTIDAAYPALMAERGRLLSERGRDVLDRLPGTEDVERELLAGLAHHLADRHPAHFARTPAGMQNRLTGATVALDGDPLSAVNALAPEDYCLLRRQEAGWVLAAAILCFPNRWRLRDKLGRPLPGVHAPVPGYDRALAGPVDRFLDGLRPGKGVWRTNWALNDDAALFQPEETSHSDPRGDVTTENAGDRLFLRVERQTLVKLPESGAVAFGIRTYQRPIGELSGEEARRFAAVLRSVPLDSARYKGLHRTAALALGVLELATA